MKTIKKILFTKTSDGDNVIAVWLAGISLFLMPILLLFIGNAYV